MNKTILLIEDNLEVRENTAEILELSNYNVLTAENGKIGVDLARTHKPDLIICDIMMPELDGYGVLHLLGKQIETASIPFIFLTAKAEKNDFRKGMTLGADDYLTKPYDDLELLNAIEMRLKKTESLKKEFEKSAKGFDDFVQNAKQVQDFDSLSNDRNLKSYKAKETIFKEGNYPSFLYLINKGKVKIFKSSENSKDLITGIYGQGDFIGYTALLEDISYNESAEALEDTELYAIPKNDFFTLLYGNREVSARFIKLLSSNVIDREENLVKLAYNSVRKRVAEALIKLNDQYNQSGKPSASIPVSRETIANMVGTATESVIRTLSDFKDEKLITIDKGVISILSVDKLKRLKN